MADISRALGSGLLRKTAEDLKLYPEYQKHVVDRQSQGLDFHSYEEWKKKRSEEKPTD